MRKFRQNLPVVDERPALAPDVREALHLIATSLGNVETKLDELAKVHEHYMAEQTRTIALVSRSFPRKLLDVVRSAFAPRLGILSHHDPRPFSVPDWYNEPQVLQEYPVVSIVTPSFHQARYLENTIRSVLSQGYPRLEYLVKDGGSTDGSVEILDRWKAQLTHVESGPDGGQADAINQAFQRTSGEIMAYLNSDDLLLPGSISAVAAYFAAHPDVDVVYGHRIVVDDYELEIGRWVLPEHDDSVLPWADLIPQETLFWRRRIWDKAGGALDSQFRFAMDWDLLLRFMKVGAKFARIGRFLGAFRMHSAQKTTQEMGTTGATEMDIIRRRYHGRPISPFETRWRIRGYLRKHVYAHWLYRLGLLRH